MSDSPSLHSIDASTRLSLQGVRIHSRISGFTNDVTMEQRFTNDSGKAVEAIYTFPLPEDAVVHTLEIHKGGSILYGEIETNEKAQDLYHDAIADGHSAYLMESHRPDIFSTLVGNLGPGESVAIHIGYLATLKPMDDTVRLSFPGTVAPRYVPQRTKGAEAILDADFVNPPHAAHVPYGLEVKVDFDKGFPLKHAESPSHKISEDKGPGGESTIRLDGGETEMNRDVVLQLNLHRQENPVAVSSVGPDGIPYMTLAFYPEIDGGERSMTPTETIFVIDASGSMHGYGNSYAQAQQALELGLRSLRIGDTFNIIRFGSTFEKWKTTPQQYSEATLQDAVDYINNSSADLGGTELLTPLADLFQQSVPGNGVRQILLLTDGQVSNEDQVHQLAREHASHNRIFSFGIGGSCSQHLVKGIAEATGGVAEFIADDERIEPIVLRTFSRMAAPMLSDLHIEFTGGDQQGYDLGTSTFPPVFDGDAYILHAQIKGGIPDQAILKGQGSEGPIQWKAKIQGATDGMATNHHKLWAAQKIRTLEAGSQTNRFESPHQRRRENRQSERIVELSLKHKVLCRLTSLVAVEYRSPQDKLDGNPELQRIPVQLPQKRQSKPHLFSGLAGGAVGAVDYSILPASVSEPSLGYEVACYRRSFRMEARSNLSHSHVEHIEEEFCKAEFASVHIPKDFDDLSDLLKLQHADGSFHPYNTSGKKKWKVANALQSLGLDPKSEVMDTLLVLKRLVHDFQSSRPQWSRAASKALAYLNQQYGKKAVGQLLQVLNLQKISSHHVVS